MSIERDPLLWANFFHLGYNTYSEFVPERGYHNPNNLELSYSPRLRFDTRLWEDLTAEIARAGGNAIVLSIADGFRYESHPEIAVEGAWTTSELRAEIKRLKGMGIQLIPKLNFSSAHDLWLGEYHRMVSTPTYYRVCADIIAELIEIFDECPWFHLGYDEETWWHQTWYEYVVLRQGDLWWRDFLWFVEQVEQRGKRPWIWSDFIWDHNDEFLARMPKSVIQSNWYYLPNFDLDLDAARAKEKGIELIEPTPGQVRTKTTGLRAYLELERGGFTQVPTGSVDVVEDNFPDTVRFARDHIPAERLMGFMQTVWRAVTEDYRDRHELGVQKFAEGVQVWNNG